IVAEGLRLRHTGDRLYYGLCRLNRRLQLAWPSRARLAALVPLPRAIQVLRPHLHGTGNPLRAGQDAGLHTEGLYRSTRSSGNNAGSDARIDCKASAVVAMLESHRAVDDYSAPEDHDRTLWRQEIGAHARCHQITRRQ